MTGSESLQKNAELRMGVGVGRGRTCGDKHNILGVVSFSHLTDFWVNSQDVWELISFVL